MSKFRKTFVIMLYIEYKININSNHQNLPNTYYFCLKDRIPCPIILKVYNRE